MPPGKNQTRERMPDPKKRRVAVLGVLASTPHNDSKRPGRAGSEVEIASPDPIYKGSTKQDRGGVKPAPAKKQTRAQARSIKSGKPKINRSVQRKGVISRVIGGIARKLRRRK